MDLGGAAGEARVGVSHSSAGAKRPPATHWRSRSRSILLVPASGSSLRKNTRASDGRRSHSPARTDAFVSDQITQRTARRGAVGPEVVCVSGDDIEYPQLVGEPDERSVGHVHLGVAVFLDEGRNWHDGGRW